MSIKELESSAVTAVANIAAAEQLDLDDRLLAIGTVIDEATKALEEVGLQIRLKEAHETASERIQPGEDGYMMHLRHCYPKDGVDGHPAGCKYGEDTVCPAALFADPWEEYLRLDAIRR